LKAILTLWLSVGVGRVIVGTSGFGSTTRRRAGDVRVKLPAVVRNNRAAVVVVVVAAAVAAVGVLVRRRMSGGG
jgi:dihydrodipicolinate reductase